MMADFSVLNPTQYRFRDIEIECTHFGPGGTEIDSNTQTGFVFSEPPCFRGELTGEAFLK